MLQRACRSATICASWLLMLICAGTPLGAQSATWPNEAQLIAAVERGGALFPRAASPAPPKSIFTTVEKGSAERRCVEGTEAGPVRSGEFVIGGQLGGTRAMTAG